MRASGTIVSDGSPSSPADLFVFVNGERRPLAPGCTVDALVRGLGLEPRRIAVAVNRDVVPRSAFARHGLSGGDRVEILEAVGGG
jgi:thiamine biosynthesis protein ThiS